MPTFIGKTVTVAEDKQLQVGDTLRDFNLTATDLTKKSLSEFEGKKKVISIVPSIDTGICSTQTRTFNKELSELDDTVVITISVDLPFARCRPRWWQVFRSARQRCGRSLRRRRPRAEQRSQMPCGC